MSAESAPAVFARPHGTDAALLMVALGAVSTSGPLMAGIAIPPLAIAFWRNAIASGLLIGAAGLRRDARTEIESLTRRELLLTLASGVLLGLHFATWVPSLTFTSVATATAICCAQPVWSAVIARYQGQHIHRMAWVGIIVAVSGVALLTGIDLTLSRRAVLGDLMALAGGALAAGYMAIGAIVRQTVSTSAYTTVCYTTSALTILPLCLIGGMHMGHYTLRSWLGIFAVTAVAQFLGHLVIARVLRSTDATFVSLVILLEVPGAAILAAIFLDQTPKWTFVPAAAMLVAGVVTVVRASARPIPVVD